MANTVSVVDGVLQYNATSSSSSSTSSSEMGKEQFLQLLVAQMKYQDPLEPMDNTEYVSQLATFTQVEELQNLGASMADMEATNLLGKQVIIETTSTSGATTQISGYVDYVQEENGEMMLGVNGSLYSISDVITVIDNDYVTAASLASQFSTLISQLPSEDELTADDQETLQAIRDIYDSLTEYQKSFISSDDLSTLTALEKVMSTLVSDEE
ncbi:flagellar hook assembly protein FlgD [Eubacterium oxidoreducens]|uniref:Basal-body rod modification protein FlgD n=1 Tax=Eubacterium oxidoreducens TaxID=1732 RepID=A0A1G6AQ17_EUBOX|nr:flagellar hook capping FlgD N-terminal domain-containing protein [Eubacterium oxidoreducens]SDB10500.1 flagellar basal-body rod modification protein FlgD [Eubacterium oxidoreducens]